MSLSVVEVLERVGGVATRTTLVDHCTRVALERAVTCGDVVRLDRSHYGHPQLAAARRLAASVGGVVAGPDAALLHGWEVARRPRRPHLVVPRGRRLTGAVPAVLHRIDLRPDQRDGPVTSRDTTLEHCLRWLPADEALAVADSARRHGLTEHRLAAIAAAATGPGAPQARRVAGAATPLAANPFESVLRSICLTVPGLVVQPQIWVTAEARADLVDTRLRIVLEADSFAWHGGRDELARDARRYNRMVVEGWLVLRFTYEDVMSRPEQVREVLHEAVAAARMQSRSPRGPRTTA